MGQLCTPGLYRGVMCCFLNGDTIPDENIPFFIGLYALVVPLKTLPDFRLQWSKSYQLSENSVVFGVSPAYS